MTPATKSALHVKLPKSHSFLSTFRSIVLKALTGGCAVVTVGFAAVAAVMMGVGWLLTISLEARAELQSTVVDAPRSTRLSRTGLLADGMPSLPALAAGLSPFPEPSSEKPVPALIVAHAFAAIDSSRISDHPAVVRVATSSETYVAKSVTYVAKTAVPDVASTGSIGSAAAIESVQPSPQPRMRSRWAALGPVEGFGKKIEEDRRKAIYDITAKTVYLPGGERLEAHSGYGRFMDDPRHVSKKNRGATPPNVYKLTLRESLFHGVQALRLTPAGDGQMYGRDGILAHSYLLGRSGQSHGCVSFKEYPKFLRAFQRGEIDRIEVVSRLDKPPTFATSPDVRNKSAGSF